MPDPTPWLRRRVLALLLTGVVTLGLVTVPAVAAPTAPDRLVAAPTAPDRLVAAPTAPDRLVAAPTAPDVDQGLVAALDEVLDDPRIDDGTTGLRVEDARDGEVLYDRDGDTPLIPASNTKLLTGAAALDVLGPDHRFVTDVLAEGRLTGRGILRGDLVLRGHGDPTALVEDYRALAADVRAAGLRVVTGDLVADDSYFDDVAYHPDWSTSYASFYYAGQISGLSIGPNTDYDAGSIILRSEPGELGEAPEVAVVPDLAAGYVEVSNQVVTVGADAANTVTARRELGTNQITITGNLPLDDAGDQTWVTVEAPELLAAEVFAGALAEQGVRLRGDVVEGEANDAASVLAEHHSMPLAELMIPFMKLSNNMHGEHLVKTMAAEHHRQGGQGEPGSWPVGIALLEQFVAEQGAEVEGLDLVDGSGLARANRIPPATLTSALRAFTDEPWFDDYYVSLPVAGVNERLVGGTLRSRMVDTPAQANLRGKTGSLSGVTALSGYVTGADGREYVFSMLNNFRGSSPRPVENEVGATLAGWG